MTAAATVSIGARFCGPPTSGNGGYTAGRLAAALGASIGEAVEVRLRRPPPIDRPLRLRAHTDGHLDLLDGPASDEVVVAEARRINSVDLNPPRPASVEEALAATVLYAPEAHPFPTCFACGPARDVGDGLRLFAGAVPGRDVFACTWEPDASVAGPDGQVAAEIVFAALDCPGGQAVSVFGSDESAVLLGTIQVVRAGPVTIGEPHVLTSWRISSEGRKHTTGVLLTDADGTELGRSRAVWIAVPAPG